MYFMHWTHGTGDRTSSCMSASLFEWLQGAAFYRALHEAAVELIPRPQANARWIDLGCGPGGLTRAAAAKGYNALGVDRSPQMIATAKRIAARERSQAQFETAELGAVSGSYEVVSAASLLAVLPDPATALEDLWALVAPSGALLVIEPTERMSFGNALASYPRIVRGRRPALLLWGRARQGRSVMQRVDAFAPPDLARRHKELLVDGLVAATCFWRR
jgi:SAM-dependent methyltransferase